MKALLVEDNSDDAMLVRSMLADSDGAPVEITHIERVSLALERLAETDFEVILLDLGLPDAEGMEAVELLARNDRAIPVVVLTGLTDERHALEALRHGAQDFLFKNHMSGEWLRSAMRHAVERQKLLSELSELQRLLLEGAQLRTLAETAGAAAHEINNPLAVIMGNLELLQEADHADRQDHLLEIVYSAVQNIEKIVRDMGQTRRYATKGYTKNTRIVDFGASAEEDD